MNIYFKKRTGFVTLDENFSSLIKMKDWKNNGDWITDDEN